MKFPDTEENRAKMSAVAENLLGTCEGLDGALQAEFGEDADLMDFDPELLRHLDSMAMLCEGCGWWEDRLQLDDNQMCADCSDQSEDE